VVVSAGIGFITLIIAHHLSLEGDTMEMMRAVLDTNFWLAHARSRRDDWLCEHIRRRLSRSALCRAWRFYAELNTPMTKAGASVVGTAAALMVKTGGSHLKTAKEVQKWQKKVNSENQLRA